MVRFELRGETFGLGTEVLLDGGDCRDDGGERVCRDVNRGVRRRRCSEQLLDLQGGEPFRVRRSPTECYDARLLGKRRTRTARRGQYEVRAEPHQQRDRLLLNIARSEDPGALRRRSFGASEPSSALLRT